MTHIEDYALVSDLQTAALISREGSVDWLCFPRFDSGACFAALLGTPDHGRWLLAPRGEAWHAGWRYRPDTLVLETEWETDGGVVRVVDFMPPRGKAPDIVRLVEGVRGEVEMSSELVIRFDYGPIVPWVRRAAAGDCRIALARPDAHCLRTPAEQLGGGRNWDSRFCWPRDATLTVLAFLNSGYLDEAGAWRNWLLRAAAGDPAALQIMYGVAGERRITEIELPWLPGYGGSKPVRVGNAAMEQFQLDVYGEVLDALHQGRTHDLPVSKEAWALQRHLLRHLEHAWKEPDEGIWEVRGPRRHFTHSKVMAWVAFDRGVQAVERFGRTGPVDRWRSVRAEIHEEVLREGFDTELDSFVGFYGAKRLDASLLVIPLVGFLPADDPRMVGTVAAIERELVPDRFVQRYRADEETQSIDGLPPGEGAFLPATFWLVDNLALQGRLDEARELFERLLALRTDLGLLAEEYDPDLRRQLGNFPQAFTHVSLVNSAFNLECAEKRMERSALTQRRPEEQPTAAGY